jgi:hypothetical protein
MRDLVQRLRAYVDGNRWTAGLKIEDIAAAADRIESLERQLAEAQKPQWQPIETAPTTGRELILLLTPSRFPQVAYSNTWWTAGFSVENKPTHWMPIPTIKVMKPEPEEGGV